MPIRLALAQIRVQKLKSFFTLLGVTIGVMFLIAVVSIVEGMSKLHGARFRRQARRREHVHAAALSRISSGDISEETWREWQRRPRIYYSDLEPS